MSQTDKELYRDSQVLIEVWEALSEVMPEQNLDILELSFKTGLEERELEDYFNNYADVKVKTLLKIARALNRTINIGIIEPEIHEPKLD